MAFPTTPVLDTFDRANESPLSGGGNWAAVPNVGNQLILTSNAVTGANIAALSSRYWTPSQFGIDTEVYCTVNTLPTGANYVRLYLGIAVPNASTENGYFLQWANDANGCRIFREDTGTPTQIAQNAAATYNAGDQLGLSRVGTTLTAYKNGVVVTSVSDGTYQTAGYLILGTRDNIGRLDLFGGGNPVPASPDQLAVGHVFGHNVW